VSRVVIVVVFLAAQMDGDRTSLAKLSCDIVELRHDLQVEAAISLSFGD